MDAPHLLEAAHNTLIPPVVERQRLFTLLARMLQSGLTLVDALETIIGTSRGRLRDMAASGRDGLKRGCLLADSLCVHPGLFSSVHRTLVAAGEQSGRLVPVLQHLALIEGEKLAAWRRIASSLAYPLLVLVLSCLIMPIPTLVTGSTAAYTREVLSRLLALAALLGGAWVAVAVGARHAAAVLGFVPGVLERQVLAGRRALFFLVLKTAVESGLTFRDALALGATLWASRENRRAVQGAIRALDGGESLTAALGLFLDSDQAVVLAAGERAGKFDESLGDIARELKERADRRRRTLLMVGGALLAVGILAYVASQILSGMQASLEPSAEEMKQIQRELKGIWRFSP